MEPEFISQLKEMEGIEKVLPLYVFNGRMTADGIPLNRLEATDRLDWYGPMMALHYSEKDMEASAISAFASGRAVILSTDCMERTGSTVGGLLSLSDGTVQQDYLIAGSFKSRATDVEAVIPVQSPISEPPPTALLPIPPPIPTPSWYSSAACLAKPPTGAAR